MAKKTKKAVEKKEKLKAEPVAELLPDVVSEEPIEDIVVVEEISEPVIEKPLPDDLFNPTLSVEFSEFTIKEIMIQKNVDRERAIEILRNHAK
jgi:hypothetical protein